MDTPEIRKYLHDLSNALNAAKINAYLLRRMHGELLDKETVDGLDASLLDAEKLVGEFHHRVHSEMAEEKGAFLVILSYASLNVYASLTQLGGGEG